MKASLVNVFPVPFCVKRSSASDTRLLEITQLALNPPRAPTPVEEVPTEAEVSTEGGLDISTSTQPVVSTSGSFAFLTASELEPPFEDNAEWVERSDAAEHQEEQVEEPVNGLVQPEEPVTTGTPPDESVSPVYAVT
jgi:hypothetical protein